MSSRKTLSRSGVSGVSSRTHEALLAEDAAEPGRVGHPADHEMVGVYDHVVPGRRDQFRGVGLVVDPYPVFAPVEAGQHLARPAPP